MSFLIQPLSTAVMADLFYHLRGHGASITVRQIAIRKRSKVVPSIGFGFVTTIASGADQNGFVRWLLVKLVFAVPSTTLKGFIKEVLMPPSVCFISSKLEWNWLFCLLVVVFGGIKSAMAHWSKKPIQQH